MAKPTLDDYFAQKEKAETETKIGNSGAINELSEDVLRDSIMEELSGPVENIQQIGKKQIDKNQLLLDLNNLMAKYGYNPRHSAEQQIIATFISNLYSI